MEMSAIPGDDATGAAGGVLRAVNRFYEENPFPGFDLDKYRTRDDLARQASWWAHKLDAEIPFDADVVDVGCGTGQLACFLGLKGRRVLGVDYSQHSLELAWSLRNKLRLAMVAFARHDVLHPGLAGASFDYVFCNGVLHHTSDPYGGFRELVRIARPGGFVVVGLYNSYGRLMLRVRRHVVQWQMRLDPGAKDRALRKQLVRLEDDPEKRRTWWADQYEHPHESCHTVDEVLRWFAANDVDYVSSFPKAELSASGQVEKIFRARRAGRLGRSRLAHVLVQLAWIATQNAGGGYFVTIGRKRT